MHAHRKVLKSSRLRHILRHDCVVLESGLTGTVLYHDECVIVVGVDGGYIIETTRRHVRLMRQ